MAVKKKTPAKPPETMLTTAAQAVGAALGKLARKVGVAPAPAIPPKPARRKTAPKKKTVTNVKRTVAAREPERAAAARGPKKRN